MVFHLLVMVALALWWMPAASQATLPALVVNTLDKPEEELQTVELDQRIEAASEVNFALTNAAAAASGKPPKVSDPELDRSLIQEEVGTDISIDGLLDNVPSRGTILSEVPHGAPGQARAITDNYQQAMDRLTQEIMWMLSKQQVLVIWCFDQSKSMKDDQKEIRDRVERVYTELGLAEAMVGDALLTVVASYGQNVVIHTKNPTSDLEQIRKAINEVPVDVTGKEMMCQAVGGLIREYRRYASKGHRKMALVLVTDESGELEDNLQNLERMISEAKSARCVVYVLGREAVFGHPYAYLRWVHPETKRPHWLRMNRGPETAFIEQIQTDGFRRRYDAYPSGFGPYGLSRLAHQTSGIYFVLPSVEPNLIRGEKRRYELEAMRGYKPDLRARIEILRDRDRSKLRTVIWQVVNQLNPYNEQTAKIVELRVHFSKDPETFVRQVAEEHKRAQILLANLVAASKRIESVRGLLDEEPSPRWKANYALLRAQLLVYQVRAYEYGACLEEFVKHPRQVPLTKPPNLRLTRWDIGTRAKTLTGELTAAQIERAKVLFAEVIKEHPGTPWAARAKWEQNRGFGVQLTPYYEPPYGESDIPPPNL